jgi:hypothetical protein
MRKRARTDLCGGRSVMVVPTAPVGGGVGGPGCQFPEVHLTSTENGRAIRMNCFPMAQSGNEPVKRHDLLALFSQIELVRERSDCGKRFSPVPLIETTSDLNTNQHPSLLIGHLLRSALLLPPGFRGFPSPPLLTVR